MNINTQSETQLEEVVYQLIVKAIREKRQFTDEELAKLTGNEVEWLAHSTQNLFNNFLIYPGVNRTALAYLYQQASECYGRHLLSAAAETVNESYIALMIDEFRARAELMIRLVQYEMNEHVPV